MHNHLLCIHILHIYTYEHHSTNVSMSFIHFWYTCEICFKWKSWVPLGEYRTYIPTYTTNIWIIQRLYSTLPRVPNISPLNVFPDKFFSAIAGWSYGTSVQAQIKWWNCVIALSRSMWAPSTYLIYQRNIRILKSLFLFVSLRYTIEPFLPVIRGFSGTLQRKLPRFWGVPFSTSVLVGGTNQWNFQIFRRFLLKVVDFPFWMLICLNLFAMVLVRVKPMDNMCPISGTPQFKSISGLGLAGPGF